MVLFDSCSLPTPLGRKVLVVVVLYLIINVMHDILGHLTVFGISFISEFKYSDPDDYHCKYRRWFTGLFVLLLQCYCVHDLIVFLPLFEDCVGGFMS